MNSNQTDRLNTIRKNFLNDHWATAANLIVDSVEADAADCHFDVADLHRNATGAVQGGAIYTLADCATAICSNAAYFAGEDRHNVAVTQSTQMLYLRAAVKSTLLKAHCSAIFKGKNTAVYRVTVTDETERLIAEMTANMQIVTLK
jgi:acyl-CoA thioesterase